MSTRANIIIKDEWGHLTFYRHSDGYPEGTLPTLKKFMSWVKTKKIRNNVGQAAGWLILIGAEEYGYINNYQTGERIVKPNLTEPSDDLVSGWKCGSYEPSVGVHGDIVYLYTLDLNNLTIKVQHVGGDNDQQTVETITDFTDTTEKR